jgi:hypothetical protein
LLGERLAEFLKEEFPGLPWDRASERTFVDALDAAFLKEPDAYVVHREELPEGEPIDQALRDGFGAEPGDEIVEVRSAPQSNGLNPHRWLQA